MANYILFNEGVKRFAISKETSEESIPKFSPILNIKKMGFNIPTINPKIILAFIEAGDVLGSVSMKNIKKRKELTSIRLFIRLLFMNKPIRMLAIIKLM